MATISFEFSDKAYEVLEEVRRAVLEKMEDTEDLRAVEDALREDDGETISHAELWRRLKA